MKEKEKHVENELKVKSWIVSEWRHAAPAPALANLNAQEPKVKGRPSSAMHWNCPLSIVLHKHCTCLHNTIRHANERLSNVWRSRGLEDHFAMISQEFRSSLTEASIFFDVPHQSSQSSLSLPQALPTTLFISNVYKVSSFSCWSLIVAWSCFLSCTCCSS